MEVFEPLEEFNERHPSRRYQILGGIAVVLTVCLLWASSAVSHPYQLNGQQLESQQGVVGDSQADKGTYPGYPECRERVDWLKSNWNISKANYKMYSSAGVDGSISSILAYLNQHGLYCPTAEDANREMIRGVSLGGWLVLEPWIVPSLFEQFTHLGGLSVEDQWMFCQVLGKEECRRQLEHHWNTWVIEDDVKNLAEGGINHVRIPVGYWIMGDIRDGEPWVTGELRYLQRAMLWFKKYNISVLFDLHCAPGSQNGFDNSGKKGAIHWADPSHDQDGNVFYPNLDRSLTVLEALVAMFSLDPFEGVVKYIELVNEAFISIPIDVVKSFYVRGYWAIRNINPSIGIVIGDSFRLGDWSQFMYPPDYNHVYIDTHIYQVFDSYRLAMTTDQHVEQTCSINRPEVAVAPLSIIVGEWSAAMTDCALWINGFKTGSRYDGTFTGSKEIGSCDGEDKPSTWSNEYTANLRKYVEAQMTAYESGSSQGWFFWNFKTERAPQWNYLLGLQMGWIPSSHENRNPGCQAASPIISKRKEQN